MLTRFNFYDIYGYLIPGIATVGLCGIPFWTLGGLAPDANLATAFVGLAGAYVAGNLVHELARKQLPVKDPKSDRYPGDYVLDPGLKKLSPALRATLAARVDAEFGLRIGGGREPTLEGKEARNEAMMLCRDRLTGLGRSAGADQMEGMYALHRGLGVAFGLGAMVWLGWFAGSIVPSRPYWLVGAVSTIAGWLLLESFGGAAKKLEKTTARWNARPWPIATVTAALAGGALFAARDLPVVGVACAVVCAIVMLLLVVPLGLVAFAATAVVASLIGATTNLVALLPVGSVLLVALLAASAESFRRFSEQFAVMTFRSFVALEAVSHVPSATAPTVSDRESGEL